MVPASGTWSSAPTLSLAAPTTAAGYQSLFSYSSFASSTTGIAVTVSRNTTAGSFNWIGGASGSGNGNWSNSANWAAGGVSYTGVYPGMVNTDTAAIDLTAQSSPTITMNSPQTIASLTLANAGSLTLNGASTLTVSSALSVGAGQTLQGNGLLAAPVTLAGGTLAGTLGVTGNVTSTGGAISPAGAGTIGTIGITGNLSLNSSSVLTYDLGGSSSDLITVSGSGAGNLLLGGTLNLSQASSLGMGGTYTLMTYTGSLTGSLAIGTGLSAYTTRIVTSTPGQVNLVATPICVWTQITQTNGESGAPSYSWNTAANWSVAGSTGVAFPNGVDAVATIPLFAPGYDGGNCETINLNQAITVGTLTVANGSAYGDSHGMRYFISAGTGGSLTFQVSSGTALLQENINDVYGTGAGVIYAPMTFASNTVVNTSSVNPDGFSLYNGGAGSRADL